MVERFPAKWVPVRGLRRRAKMSECKSSVPAMPRILKALFVLLAGSGASAEAGFRSPESVVRNVY
ncbi:MAG TPA: hypothetical protein VE087_03075, partial [Xanthobacteraceae bacterium]|nr:hypothetical protein [Xanthobacteraceae bacterium]